MLRCVVSRVSAILVLGVVALWAYAVRSQEKSPKAEPDPQLDHAIALLKSRSIGTDGADLVRFFRERTLTDADRAKLADTVQRLGDEEFDVREKASAELVRAGRRALPFLRPAAADPDPERSRRARDCIKLVESGADVELALAAARVMANRRPDGAAPVLLSYFAQADDEYLEETILRTLVVVGVKDGRPDAALVRALADIDPAQRAAAAHILGRAAPGERDAVRKLFADREPRVRFEAADALVRRGDRNAVAVLIDLLGDGPMPLARRAQDTLYHLANEQSPPGLARDAERGKVRDDWAAWWKERGPNLDLAKISWDEQGRGVYLVCEAEGAGKPLWVTEYGSDGKARWKIEGLDSPSDAELLPGGHILLAESHPSRVTERDREGKILWTVQTQGYLTSVQRLPNGRTFIGTYSQILEVDRDGKTIASIRPPSGGLYCAQKLRDGRIVVVDSAAVHELDAEGKPLRSTNLPRQNNTFARVEMLANGHYLVAMYGANKAIEFDSTGKTYFEVDVQTASSAIRLANGHTIVTSMDPKAIVEFDRAGKEVSRFATPSRPFRVRRY
jgi:HEAT repeat protein